GMPAETDEMADAFKQRPEILQRLSRELVEPAARGETLEDLRIKVKTEFEIVPGLSEQQRFRRAIDGTPLDEEGIHGRERRQAVQLLKPRLQLARHAALYRCRMHGYCNRLLVPPCEGSMPSFCNISAARSLPVFTQMSYNLRMSRSSKARASCEMSAKASTNCRNFSASSP